MIPENLLNWSNHLPEAIIQRARQDSIGQLLHVCALGIYSDIGSHKAVRPEPIDEHILIYCYAGKGYYSTPTERVEVTPGNVFVIPAGMAHEYGNAIGTTWSILWVHFAGSRGMELARRLSKLPHRVESPAARITTIFVDMLTPLAAGWYDANIRFANHVLWHFLGVFLESECIGLPAPSTVRSVSAKVIERFSSNLGHHHTLASLSASLGMSASHLSACFKAETGTSPIEHLIHMRIIEAARLLETSPLRIGEISLIVGYPDTKFFSKTFRRIMGISPRDYRNRHSNRVVQPK